MSWRRSRRDCCRTSASPIPIAATIEGLPMASSNDDPHALVPDTAPPTAQPPQDAPRQGWLGALRARLGLGAQQTLRETLEEAVRSETAGDSTFSSTER